MRLWLKLLHCIYIVTFIQIIYAGSNTGYGLRLKKAKDHKLVYITDLRIHEDNLVLNRAYCVYANLNYRGKYERAVTVYDSTISYVNQNRTKKALLARYLTQNDLLIVKISFFSTLAKNSIEFDNCVFNIPIKRTVHSIVTKEYSTTAPEPERTVYYPNGTRLTIPAKPSHKFLIEHTNEYAAIIRPEHNECKSSNGNLVKLTYSEKLETLHGPIGDCPIIDYYDKESTDVFTLDSDVKSSMKVVGELQFPFSTRINAEYSDPYRDGFIRFLYNGTLITIGFFNECKDYIVMSADGRWFSNNPKKLKRRVVVTHNEYSTKNELDSNKFDKNIKDLFSNILDREINYWYRDAVTAQTKSRGMKWYNEKFPSALLSVPHEVPKHYYGRPSFGIVNENFSSFTLSTSFAIVRDSSFQSIYLDFADYSSALKKVSLIRIGARKGSPIPYWSFFPCGFDVPLLHYQLHEFDSKSSELSKSTSILYSGLSTEFELLNIRKEKSINVEFYLTLCKWVKLGIVQPISFRFSSKPYATVLPLEVKVSLGIAPEVSFSK